MKQRAWPLWLLRDAPALLAVSFSFWPVTIFTIITGETAMRDSRTPAGAHAKIALLLAIAEAWLDWAFLRQAYRRLGWNSKLVKLHVIPPTTLWPDTIQRFRAYLFAFRHMQMVVDSHVERLRMQYRIKASALVAHGSTDARLRRAAHHELVGVAMLMSRNASPLALILSSDRRERPSKDERGSTHARGPPPPLLPKNKGRALQDHLLRERGLVSFCLAISPAS